MSEFWESQVTVEAEPEKEFELEMDNTMELHEQVPAPPALTMSSDDFAALEDRVLRAVMLVKEERQARLAAEARAAKAEADLRETAPQLEKLETELAALKSERDQVRQRVERLLQQLDALEL